MFFQWLKLIGSGECPKNVPIRKTPPCCMRLRRPGCPPFGRRLGLALPSDRDGGRGACRPRCEKTEAPAAACVARQTGAGCHVRLPIPIAAFRAQGRLCHLSARSGPRLRRSNCLPWLGRQRLRHIGEALVPTAYRAPCRPWSRLPCRSNRRGSWARRHSAQGKNSRGCGGAKPDPRSSAGRRFESADGAVDNGAHEGGGLRQIGSHHFLP